MNKKFKKYQRLYKKYWFSFQNQKINLKISWDSTFKQKLPTVCKENIL